MNNSACLNCKIIFSDEFICDDCWVNFDNKILHELISEYLKKSAELMNFLEIPYTEGVISKAELYSILTDHDKCKKIISKLNCKAFW